MKRSRMIVMALLLTVGLGASGCNRHGWQLFGAVVEATAYVAVTAMVLAAHDSHHHHHHCGHAFVVYEGRPVYEYRGRWEYYDPYSDTWYYYPDGVPGY